MSAQAPGGQRLEGLPPHVVVRQLYLGCLSQASYLVGDSTTGRAIAVDPRRDIADLMEAAEAEGLRIELVVETHFHADFLSGHLELAAATGAEVAYGEAAITEFASRPLADGERIDLGGVQVEVMSTPGHTPESISLLVRPSADEPPVAALTGDALFIGDVGRPDLLVAADIAAEDLAEQLYHSVHRLAELPEETLVLPAHGAGSACGKSLSSETVSTIGEQLRTNYALQPMPVETFISLVTEEQPAAPAYFAYDANLNGKDRPLLDENAPLEDLSLEQVDEAVADGAMVVDTRAAEEFARGHLAGALNLSLGGRFAEQAGSIIPAGTAVVLAGEPEAAQEARLRLARIGFDGVLGVLSDLDRVLIEHPDRAHLLSRLTVEAFGERQAELGDTLQFLDVRNPSEVAATPVPGPHNIPLADLRSSLGDLDRDRPVVLMCAGGTRSAIASSMLLAEGFTDVSDILGGAAAFGVVTACSSASACSTAS